MNDPIIATDDNRSAQQDTPITIDVLENDQNVDGDSLTVSVSSPPANGNVVVNGDGTLRYTPDAGFTGTDTFTYTITSPSGVTIVANFAATLEYTHSRRMRERSQLKCPLSRAIAELSTNDFERNSS